MYVIGFHGYAESGKDTAYKILQEKLPGGYVKRDAFADRLKISAMKALGETGSNEQLIYLANHLKTNGRILVSYDSEDLGFPISGREYLQLYGTEAHRDVFGYDFWLDAVLPLNNCRNDAHILAITDVRFPNEAQRVKDYRGILVKINRDSIIPENNHSSEQLLPDGLFDYVIDNNGTLGDFEDAIMETWGDILAKSVFR